MLEEVGGCWRDVGVIGEMLEECWKNVGGMLKGCWRDVGGKLKRNWRDNGEIREVV